MEGKSADFPQMKPERNRNDMKIYDITQPLFECVVFPGDTKPQRKIVQSIEGGDPINLTDLTLCAHNGTHVDAPRHFLKDGKGVDGIPLDACVGYAYVTTQEGDVRASNAREILAKAAAAKAGAEKKILIRGKATVTLEAAEVFAGAGVDLVGNESQTVGPEDAPMAVHLCLLRAGVVLLEGIRLERVPDGVYFLNCAPLNLTDADGAPCRALLIEPCDAPQGTV